MVSQDIKKEILKNLTNLEKLSKEEILKDRYCKFRNIGEYKEVHK